MRVFLIACVAVVVLAVGAFLSLSTVQKPSGQRWTTEGARISPGWSFRQIFARKKAAPNTVAMAMPSGDSTEDTCDVSNAWAMILADFSSPEAATDACAVNN